MNKLERMLDDDQGTQEDKKKRGRPRHLEKFSSIHDLEASLQKSSRVPQGPRHGAAVHGSDYPMSSFDNTDSESKIRSKR